MDTNPQHKPPSIEGLCHLNAESMDKLELRIHQNLKTNVPLLKELALYLFSSGGKRIRPLLTLASGKLCGESNLQQIELAAVIEYIHTATLLHDDVVDESTLRRGTKAANQVWTNQACILAGDYLFSKAFQMCTNVGSIAALSVISETCSALAEAEVAQLALGRDISLSQERYMEIIDGKTARLFEAACKVGAIASDASKEQIEALGNYGLNLGIAFQLIDDLLDYTAQQKSLGKAIGDDFRDGSVTLPVILAIQKADNEELSFWKRSLQDLNQADGDLEAAIELMNQHGTLTQSFKEARIYADKAVESLTCFPESPLKAALIETAEFCVHRYY